MRSSEILLASALTFGALAGTGCSADKPQTAPQAEISPYNAEARYQLLADKARQEIQGDLKTGKVRVALGLCIGWSVNHGKNYAIVISPAVYNVDTDKEVFEFMASATAPTKKHEGLKVLDGPTLYAQKDAAGHQISSTSSFIPKQTYQLSGTAGISSTTFEIRPNHALGSGQVAVDSQTQEPIMIGALAEGKPADFPAACKDLQSRYTTI